MAYQHVESMGAPDAPGGAPVDGGSPPPWPWWYAPVGFLGGFMAAVMLGVFLGAAGALAGADLDDPSPAMNIMVLFAQDVALVGTAVLLAWHTARPRAWHFGLRRVPFRRAAWYAVAGYGAFWLFAIVYAVVFHPEGKQSVAEELGVNRGTAALIAAAIVVIVVAPVAEELFFRGFFFRALRNGAVARFGRPSGVLLAALVTGAVFGVIHFEGRDTVSLLPLLAVLGFVFCLVYEYTGTLFTTIALHAANNTVAFAVTADNSAPVAVPLGLAMITASVLVPRLIGGGSPGGRPRETGAGP